MFQTIPQTLDVKLQIFQLPIKKFVWSSRKRPIENLEAKQKLWMRKVMKSQAFMIFPYLNYYILYYTKSKEKTFASH